MNNLHRELAPISDAAWAQIEEETARTLKRHLAGRRVVDVSSPEGAALPGVGTGHLLTVAPPAEGIMASQREVKAFTELRLPLSYPARRLTMRSAVQRIPTGNLLKMPLRNSRSLRVEPFSTVIVQPIFMECERAPQIPSSLCPLMCLVIQMRLLER
jgi:hypothetical protein